MGSGNGQGAEETGASEVLSGVPVGCLGLVMHSRGDDIKAVAHAVSAKKPPHDGKDRERLAFQLEQ